MSKVIRLNSEDLEHIETIRNFHWKKTKLFMLSDADAAKLAIKKYATELLKDDFSLEFIEREDF